MHNKRLDITEICYIGSGLLYKRLLPIMKHEWVILADDLESIHLANVRGGLKFWRLYEALQVL